MSVSVGRGYRLEWQGDEFVQKARADVMQRLKGVGRLMQAAARENLQKEGHGKPSLPGQPPHLQTGDLYRSVFWRLEPAQDSVVIGCSEFYGYVLEFGRTGGLVIRPKNAKFFRWIDPQTGEVVFARQVTLGAIARRPWLLRSITEHRELAEKAMGSARYGGSLLGFQEEG